MTDDLIARAEKIASQAGNSHGSDCIRELVAALREASHPVYCLGVTTIKNVAKHGQLCTDHVSFIAASDLMYKCPYEERDRLAARLQAAEAVCEASDKNY